MWEQGNYLIGASDVQRAEIPNEIMSVGRSPTYGTTPPGLARSSSTTASSLRARILKLG